MYSSARGDGGCDCEFVVARWDVLAAPTTKENADKPGLRLLLEAVALVWWFVGLNGPHLRTMDLCRVFSGAEELLDHIRSAA